jgi:hypothetical protein
LIGLLSIFTAFASWQGSVADSKQSEHELLAMQDLNDGNAEYLSANQFIVYDYTMYDGWYTTSDPVHEEYYQYFTKDEPTPRRSPKTRVRAYARTLVFGLFQVVS